MSANALAAETGVAQATLSRWLRGAATVAPKMARRDKHKKKNSPPPERRPQDWTAEEKVALVLEVAAMPPDELGAFLRRKGVHEAQLAEWRDAMTAALRPPSKRERKAANIDKHRIRKLEREVARKDKALAEAAALIVLKKKAQAIWGDEDDDTTPPSDE